MNVKLNLFAVAVALFCLSSASVIIPGGDGVEDNVVEGYVSSGKSPAIFEECLRKDSISCVQMQIFRMAKHFFDQPSFSLIDGVTFDKNKKSNEGERSLEYQENLTEEKISKARSTEERESVLESYLLEESRNFFEKRNVNYNLEELARHIKNIAPENVKKVVSELMIEGRGRKKMFRMLLPFLLGLKVKLATVIGLSYLGVILLAKKALLLSVVSIAISIFLLVKKLMYHGHEEVHPGHGYGGWQSHSDAGHVEYAPNSPPAASQMAYSAQKP